MGQEVKNVTLMLKIFSKGIQLKSNLKKKLGGETYTQNVAKLVLIYINFI